MIHLKGGDEGDINLKSFYMGSRYAKAFSKGIKNNTSVKHINISRNNLKDKGMKEILDNIPESVESIDLSNNDKIGCESYQRLALLLDNPHQR